MYEQWKSIEYDPRYEVSNFGRFRKKLKKGYRYLKPFPKHKHIKTSIYCIKIGNKERNCARLVANAFIQPLTSDDCVFHKNGLQFDNHFRNLDILTRQEVSKKTGHISRSQSVVLIKNGEIKKWYRSGRVAGKELFISYQTVSDYCNGKVKNKMYNLMWEDDYFKQLEKEGR